MMEVIPLPSLYFHSCRGILLEGGPSIPGAICAILQCPLQLVNIFI